METQMKEFVKEELKHFYCSILLDEVREKVRKLKAYGVQDAEIDAVMHDEELLPRLTVTKDYKIVIADGHHTEVVMEPLVKAVYLLFLKHPEGIVLKCLSDYREELTQLYLLLRPAGLTDRVRKSIEDVTDSTQNSINEKCTRIRKAFAGILPQGIARYYVIAGKRGEAKYISLPRVNVVWACQLPSSQGLSSEIISESEE